MRVYSLSLLRRNPVTALIIVAFGVWCALRWLPLGELAARGYEGGPGGFLFLTDAVLSLLLLPATAMMPDRFEISHPSASTAISWVITLVIARLADVGLRRALRRTHSSRPG